MKRVVAFMLLWGSSSVVLADSATNSADLSMRYLGQIFGDVPGALAGSGTGLVGGLFNIFNQGVMAVAAIWLMYTIFQVCMMTATQDHPQKTLKNWSLWLRVSLGFGLLIPGPSGYCLAQELMMQVVVQGVNLANKTWDYALDYMQHGGAIFVPPTSKGGITDISQLNSYIGGDGSAESANTVMYQVFNNEVCMYISNQYNQANKDKDQIAKSGSKVTYHMIGVEPQFDGSGKLMNNTAEIFMPGYGNTNVDMPISGQAASDNCGSITIPTLPASATETEYNQAYQAIMGVALAIQPFAIDVAHSIYATNSNNPSSDLNQKIGSQALFNAVTQYMSLIQPAANSLQAVVNKNSNDQEKAFVEQAEKQGWFNAGAFYWDLVRWNDKMATQDKADPTVYVPAISASLTGQFPNALINAISVANAHLGVGMWNDAREQLSTWISGNTTADYHHINVTGGTYIGWDFGIITKPINHLVGVINRDLANNNMKAYNPMQVSYDVGKESLGAAGYMWKLLIVVITPIAVAGGICDAANPGAVIFKGLISWLTPLMTAASGFLFASGVMLTFYAPLYPYLLFLFGVIGWLLYVVEAMVAAPLVAFGMSHPEGHDFLGRAEQALMLALGVFLRPTLMIIGYLVGVLMVYVASGFMDQVLGRVFVSTYNPNLVSGFQGDSIDGLWTSIAGSVTHNSALTGHDLSDTMLVPVVLTLYGMIMLEVVNQCFSAIHQVPDMVLRWIGGPVQQDQSAQHAQAIKGALSQTGQQAGSMGSEAAKAGQGMGQFAAAGIGDMIASNKNLNKDKSEGDDAGGAGGAGGGADGAAGGGASGGGAAAAAAA